MLQDKLGKQNFPFDMKQKFKPVSEATKESANEIPEAVKLKGEETMKTMHEV